MRRLGRLTKADKAVANSLNLEWLKLTNAALRAFPGSPRQKELIRQARLVPKYKKGIDAQDAIC